MRYWKQLGLLVASCALGLTVAEIGLRTFATNPYDGSNTFVVPIRMAQPNRQGVISRRLIDPNDPTVRLRTNARSYQVPDQIFEEPQAEIVFFGGSTTECVAVSESLRFPTLVSELLAEEGFRVNTYNIARAGNTLHDSLNVLTNHVVLDDFDYAVMMHAINDVGVLRRHGDYQSRMVRPVSWAMIQTWLKQRSSAHSYLLARLRFIFASLQGMGHSPRRQWDVPQASPLEPFEQRIQAFIHLSRAFGMEPILMTQPTARFENEFTPDWKDDPTQALANQAIRAIGRAEGAPIIDLMREVPAREPRWAQPGVVFYDGVHVNDSGSQLYARIVADALATRILANIESARGHQSPQHPSP